MAVAEAWLLHRMSVVAFLARIGLGADGHSSSAYGPQEACRHLQGQHCLAPLLALATAITVGVISSGCVRVIEHFPHGGGGHVVASKLLGAPAGVVSGAAPLVDYVASIAGGGDALFSLLPSAWRRHDVGRLSVEAVALALLIVMSLRGVKESVATVAPVFLAFVVTRVVHIVGGIAAQACSRVLPSRRPARASRPTSPPSSRHSDRRGPSPRRGGVRGPRMVASAAP